ncbi:hypothetical protein C1645_838539, partial [Glomus cerebriforme]
NIEFEIYINLSKWLIQLCHNNDSLFKLWSDVLFHNNSIDKSILKSFIEQIQKNISNDDAIALEIHFKRIPKSCQNDVNEVFRNHSLFLLRNPIVKWTDLKISAIKNLIQNDDLNWQREDIIQSLEIISQSGSLELLYLFPEILDNWFNRDFSDTKGKKLPTISKDWFTFLLNKLETNNTNKSLFVFSVFQQLERLYPLLGHRKNIWQNLTNVAADRMKACSESQIFGVIKFVVQIKEREVKELFSDIIVRILNINIQQINDQLINRIFLICNCKGKTLEVPNALQDKLTMSNASGQHLNIIKSKEFWIIVFNATGNVEKLHANSYVQSTQMLIIELNRLFLERTINMKLLQQLLEYPDEQLFQYFDKTIGSLDNVIISQDKIAELRKLHDNYQHQFEMIVKFFDKFCSVVQVTDRNDYIQNIQNSELKQLVESNYLENTFGSLRCCYKYYQSQVFQNIFEACIKEDYAATKVEYIVQKLIPIVFEKYNSMCKQLKEWEKLKCSDVSLFWKNVTDVNAELDLMEGYKFSENKHLVRSLDNFSRFPLWIERLTQFEIVVKIFKIPHNEDDWLSKSIRILSDKSLIKLRKLDNFFDYLDRKFSNDNQDCWKLIEEISNAKVFMSFLKKFGKNDVRNLINTVNDNSDENLINLIQADVAASLTQVKQSLLNNNKIESIARLLDELVRLIKMNHTLGEKIALCNSRNITLQIMYNYIQNHEEDTWEKIKNSMLNGTFTFTHDEQKILDKNLGNWVKKMSTLVGVNQLTQLRNNFTRKDLFIGFNKDKTLQSLIINVIKTNFEANNEEILEKCKECLIATASSDGIVRAERSALDRDEVDRWKHVYFHQQHHDSIYDYFDALLSQEVLADPKGHLVIVKTFSDIDIDVNSCLQDLTKCQVNKLSTFRTEAQILKWVKHFWLESNDHMLILQCDIKDIYTIKLVRFIEEFRNDFIKMKDQMEHDMPMKHSCIIFHINRNEGSVLASNFIFDWKQVVIESLDQKTIPLHNLLDNSLYDIVNSDYFKKIVNSTMPFEKILEDELLWCFSCIRYQFPNEIYIRTLYKEILNDASFIQCIKTKTLKWIFKNCKDWQFELKYYIHSKNYQH